MPGVAAAGALHAGDVPPMLSRGRLTELDAMRGVAACAVLISHCLGHLTGTERDILRVLSATPLRPAIAGRGAVLFFFVLSGLVLTRMLLSARSSGFALYATRRIIRLCVPTAAVLLLTVGLLTICGRSIAWRSPMGWHAITGLETAPWPVELFRQALLIGADGDFYLDRVLWSLVHEIRLSLLLPLVVALALRWDRRGEMLLLLAGSMLYGIELGDHLLGGGVFPGTGWEVHARGLIYVAVPTGIFIWFAIRIGLLRILAGYAGRLLSARWLLLPLCVLIGIVLASWVGDSGRVLAGRGIPRSLLVTLYFAPCFLIGVALSLGALEPLVSRPGDRRRWVIGAMLLLCYDNTFATVAASVLLIQAAREPGRLRSLLRTAPLLLLGRISFSLYLVHLPVMWVLLTAFHRALPQNTVIALSLFVSLIAAWVLYRIAELPAQRLVHRIGGSRAMPRWHPTHQAAATRIPNSAA